MINFPIFQRLEVTDYGLYPGTDDKPGLHIDFEPGLTLILGANGLGKTTLITMLYRALAGGWELSKTTLFAAELGGASLEEIRMNATDRALFADRVQDLATHARLSLTITIGGQQVVIKRRLENLGLISLQVGTDDPITDEDVYRATLPALCGVASFGDLLLLLRHLVFYFEDRRSLVWDASAQSQILRIIFLPILEAGAWYKKEREILTLDSNVRNLTAALNRLRKRIASDEKATGNAAALRTQLKSLSKLQEADENVRQGIFDEAEGLDQRRHALRRDLLAAELATDASGRKLEAEKLALLQRYFPSGQETAQYLYSLLIAQNRCAVCDSETPKVAQELSTRITQLCCVVCGSQLTPDTEEGNVTSLDKEKVGKLRDEYGENKTRVSALTNSLEKISTRYNTVVQRLIELRTQIDDRGQQIQKILNALPSGDAEQTKAKEELSVLGSKVTEDKTALAALANNFKTLITSANAQILGRSEEIKRSFGEFAGGFLFEQAVLKWSPTQRSVGQLGLAKVTFPAFELDLSGADFTAPTRRKGPDAVSESQREFIDLAFRMALIHVAGNGVGGTLVLDAPESSLDAVFVKRAADVLCKFSRADASNRLVVASNLIDGELLPEMIKDGITPQDQDQRLVNLMDIAVPTAALRENADAYARELKKILTAGGLQ
jgi:predicted  nucleic acid-binding Zn-ribbon protein